MICCTSVTIKAWLLDSVKKAVEIYSNRARRLDRKIYDNSLPKFKTF
jgi:hypothetical protein